MRLEDRLDDLCVRFIINLPPEELASVERICFQVEEAQWFYEDFIRPLDPTLPSLSLKQFSLRIFQHCPLFSQWSAQHHTTAFAEFLAYKQRVPVRGAILLSESMDEVVLVKGWKKGANWSFPRGKINKDEDDLDCAVREVYEETGFDVKAAGLVKPEKEMKYIEVTMREQHMRLYVFKGVPRDTHFEPRTRKEISKIEWYKLHDLPTLKKKVHHENDEHPAINANKFYMVAPFLHPLKKWISQQRKREGKYSASNLAVPPVLAEENVTDNEGYQWASVPPHNALSPPALSTLPEVLPMQQQQPNFNPDPSTHLKELLRIGGNGNGAQPASQPTIQPSYTPAPDAAKSNALLALLRNGSERDVPPQPVVPAMHGQPQFHAQSGDARTNQFPQSWQQPQTAFPTSPPTFPNTAKQSLPNPQQSLLDLFSSTSRASPRQPIPSQPAPYQQTGDPQFLRDNPGGATSPAVPPASALPKLTHHTRSLLDAFQSKQSTDLGSPITQPQPQRHTGQQQQSLLDVLRMSSPARSPAPLPVSYEGQISNPVHPIEAPATNVAAPRSTNPTVPTQSTSLLNLFTGPARTDTAILQAKPQPQQNIPAELAAAPVDSPRIPSQEAFLASLFRKEKPQEPARQRSPVAKAGQTGATISGPLNQPNLDNFVKASPPPQPALSRSPIPPNRVLYDPKQPTPMKILARPDTKGPAQSRSPRVPKSHSVVTSPNRNAKFQEKPFQPQILRRPQADSRQSLTPSPSSLAPIGSAAASRRPSNLMSASPSPNLEQTSTMSPPPMPDSRRVSEQSDSHKQTLLQLFGGPAPTAAQPMQKMASKQTVFSPGSVSPLMTAQAISPVTDDPISTRSRVGSLASIISGGPGPALTNTQEPRPKAEKRQTTAEDKAFLLNYLGKFANQEG